MKTRMAAVGLLYAVILYINERKIQVGDTGPKGVVKRGVKNMRAFRHNNKKKQGHPTCSWPELAYCTLYRILYNLLYIYELVAIGHLKWKKARKKGRRQARKGAPASAKGAVGREGATKKNGLKSHQFPPKE